MIVKEYDSVEVFLEKYETVMLEREAVSQLLLYSAYQNRYNKLTEAGMFGAVLEDEQAVLLFCNLLPTGLTVYVAGQENIASAAAVLGDYFGDNNITINGIVARNDVCQNFLEKYKKNSGKTFTEMLGMDIMEIRKVNDITPVEGVQRLAVENESKMLTDWMIEFQIEALTCELDYEAALKKIMKYIDNQSIYLFENDEHIVVTMAVITRKLPHGTAIAYVYTPEEYRGKGYAAANMYYLSKKLLEQGGEFCTLFVDKKNPLSNRAYEKVGYKILEDSYEYRIVPAE
jgi:predicted GNAT family acetyltransferase